MVKERLLGLNSTNGFVVFAVEKLNKENVMTELALAKELAKLEGKKSQVRIGDLREVIKLIQTMIAKEAFVDVDFELSRTAPTLECLCRKASKALSKK